MLELKNLIQDHYTFTLRVNSERDPGSRLPPEVVETMAGRLEAPNPMGWEQFSFTVPAFEGEAGSRRTSVEGCLEVGSQQIC